MKYDFDKVVDRHGTNCLKYDFAIERGKPADILPLWVADMDFQTAPAILERLEETVKHGIFGYSDGKEGYFAAVQNQPYEGGGFKFCPEADPGDRKLDVIVVSGLKRWQVIRTLLLAFQGKHVGHKGISIFRCEEVKIRFSQARAVHTDGEAVFLKKEIRMHVLPQQVRVITS